MNWNLSAEILGFLSGCLLLWPAIAQNSSLRSAAVMINTFKRSRSRLGKQMGRAPSVTAATQPVWSPLDQWLLTIGAVLLLASFAIRLAVLLNWVA